MTSDAKYFSRVYAISAIVWGLGLLVLICAGSLRAAVGWTTGAALSMGVLRSLELVIRSSFVPGNRRAGATLARWSIVKLLAAGAVISLLVIAGGRDFALIGAFCAGIMLTQLVIVGREVKVGGSRG